MGVAESADTGDKVKKTAPAGRPVGPPRGGVDLSFLGGLGGAAPQIFVILII